MAKTIGLVLKRSGLEALDAMRVAQSCACDARFLIEATGLHSFDRPPEGIELVDAETFQRESDIVLVLGGDGTLIHAASLLPERAVPILGVNLGHIGFLTDITREELPEVLPRALDGSLPVEERMRLDVEIYRDGEVILRGRVLNDAVVNQLGLARIAQYRIMLRNELVTTLRADGVIIATPTGSTAYSMAAGGAILAPGLACIAITPICPHSLTQRPLVVAPDGDVTVALESPRSVFASLDGQSGHPIEPGDVMKVRRAPVGTRLFSIGWRSYFQTLRTKLRWGES